MHVGISLLTLVPRISGGSETYARELVRALGRVGTGSYRVLVPTIATDVDGLPTEVVEEYRAARSMPGRIAAMTEGVVRGRRLRRRLADAGRRALPAHRDDSPRLVAACDHDRARPAARVPPAVLLTRGARVPTGGLWLVDTKEQARRHDLRARRTRRDRALRAAGEPRTPHPPRARPRRVSPRRRGAPALPRVPRPPVATQESRPPVRRVRRAPTAPSRSRARAHGVRRPDSGRRALARARVTRRARSSLPNRFRARVPEPVRRVRPTAARGDGLRLPGCQLECRGVTRGLRERSAPLRSDLDRRHGRCRRGDPGAP